MGVRLFSGRRPVQQIGAVRRRTVRSPLALLGGLLVVYLAVPVIAFLVRLGGSHDRGFATPGLWGALRVSVVSASVSTVIIAVLGIPLAHTLARSRGRVAAVVGVAVQLPLALPPLMSGILLIYIFGPYTTVGRLFHGRLTDSVTGVVLAQMFVAAPFLIIAARSAFASIDPALDDVAASLGHRPLARFWRVSLPVAAPGISAGLLLTWLRAFGEYGATVLLAYHPYSLPVYTSVQFSGTGLFTTQAPTALALGVAAVAVVLSRLRRPSLRRGSVVPAEPRHPAATPATAVAFDLDVTVGTFHLCLAHRARSHRLAIVGPSGSGKSLTLRSIAGLLGPTAGTVSYGSEAVDGLPVEDRNIGYVPQSLGLIPRRTVWQQLLFAAGAEPQLAAWWLATLRLDGLADRLPHELSGGERQRVSVAQALSRNPRLLLLDEPFSALDAPVREELRRELRRLQHDAGLSTVLVTHDPEEAALLADEIIVMVDGLLLQAGTREEVYARPGSPQVARLLGVQNLNRARTGTSTELVIGSGRAVIATHRLPPGLDVLWCIRPEHIAISPAGSYAAEILDVADLGSVTAAIVRLAGGPELRVRSIKPIPGAIGSSCRLDLDPDAITVWAEESLAPAGPPRLEPVASPSVVEPYGDG